MRNVNGVLVDSKEARVERDDQVAFNKVRKEELQELLSQLSAYDPDGVGIFNKAVEDAADADELEQLKLRADQAVKAKASEMADLRRDAVSKADIVEKEIKTRKGHANEDSAGYFDELHGRVMGARGMLASPVKEVIEQGKAEILAVEKTLKDDKSDSKKGELGTGFKEVKEFSTELRKDIKEHDALKKFAESVRKDLLNQLTVRTRAAFNKPPKSALADLTAFRDKEVKDAKDAAEAIKKKRTDLTERAETMKKTVEKDIPEFLMKYRASLLSRISSAADPSEGGEDFGDNQLDLIAAELKVAKGNESYMLARESRAENDEFEQERRKKEWEGRVKIYKKFRDAAGRSTGEIILNKKTKSLLKTVDVQFTQAERFAKNGFFDQAESTLAAAEKAARQVLRNPKGEGGFIVRESCRRSRKSISRPSPPSSARSPRLSKKAIKRRPGSRTDRAASIRRDQHPDAAHSARHELQPQGVRNLRDHGRQHRA